MFKYDFNPVGPIIGIRRDNNGMNKIDKENMLKFIQTITITSTKIITTSQT